MARISNKVAVLGCGYWGKNLVRNFAALDALVLVGDSTSAGRERARALTWERIAGAALDAIEEAAA